MPLMTDAAHIAGPGEEPRAFASIQAMIAQLFLLLAAVLHIRPMRREARAHYALACWFARREAEMLAGDPKALPRIIRMVMHARRLAHRARTIGGRFYKRRRHANWILCMEGRTAAPRRRRLSACARASIPFAPVNLAPP